ncbi:MAG: hypothetical protein AAFV80_06940 [Bacteroidota bacterium]
MLKSCIALLFSWSVLLSTVSAQMPGGGMSPPDFDAEKAAGIVEYNIDKVIKKIKVKNPDTQSAVTEALKAYNTRMMELSYAHSPTFQELDAEFDRTISAVMASRDRSKMNGFKNKIQTVLPPIRKEVMQEEQALNAIMLTNLTEKQNEKWLKYQQQQRGDVGSFARR